MDTKNNNNDIVYDNKCITHINNDIIFICSDCNFSPACIKCITTIHRGHKIDDIELDNTTIIFNRFKKDILKLKLCLDKDIQIENESNEIFKILDDKHSNNLELIKNQFKELHQVFDLVENDIIRQLVTQYDENEDINLKIKSTIDNNNKNINNILDRHISNGEINNYNIKEMFQQQHNNSNNNKQYIEIIKHYKLIMDLINKDNKNNLIDQYKNINVHHDTTAVDSIKDLVKGVFNIGIGKMKQIKFGEIVYAIYENGYIIPDDVTCIALGSNVTGFSFKSIPNHIEKVWLMDYFICSPIIGDLKELPASVNTLMIGAGINLHLPYIPSSCKSLYLLDGCSIIVSAFNPIPMNLTSLYLGNIVNPIDISLLNYNTGIQFSKNYKGVRYINSGLLAFHSKIPLTWDYPTITFL